MWTCVFLLFRSLQKNLLRLFFSATLENSFHRCRRNGAPPSFYVAVCSLMLCEIAWDSLLQKWVWSRRTAERCLGALVQQTWRQESVRFFLQGQIFPVTPLCDPIFSLLWVCQTWCCLKTDISECPQGWYYVLEYPQNNRHASKFIKLGDMQQKQIMKVQRKVRKLDEHFTPLRIFKGTGMRNWDNECCSLHGALCSTCRHDHASCVLVYFARDT